MQSQYRALHYSASRGKNWIKMCEIQAKLILGVNLKMVFSCGLCKLMYHSEYFY